MLKHHTTYEIMRPEDVGFSMDRSRAGQTQRRAGALADRPPKRLGYRDARQIDHSCSSSSKVLADKKKEIYDADIRTALIRARQIPRHLRS